MFMMKSFLILLLTFLSWISNSTAADSAAWRSRNIYFALTDRLANPSSGSTACGDLSNYCGGTFAGLQSKLDYIKGMGFDAIWITPVITNSPAGYHGYWAKDLNSINSYYGTANDLKTLVSAAHSKGIYMMVDVVANHMGRDAISGNSPSPLNQDSSYHPACTIDYNNQTSIENCRIASDLPDVFTTKSEIRSLYQNWVKSLVSTYGFDGLRIDTVKHVEKDFWQPFVQASGVYAVGEVFDGNPNYVAGYSGVMPGLLNYPIYYPLNRAYQQTGSFQDLVDMHDQISQLFPDPTLLGTFLDNHDNQRFLYQKNDKSLLKNALAYVVLARGIPIVYYGTEQGFSGGNDPANREDLWRSGYSTTSDLYQALAKFGAARKNAGGLAGNDHVHLYVTGSAYAWSRANGQLIVLTTNTGAGTSGNYCFGAQVASGTTYSNVYASGTYTVDGSGNLCVPISNGEPVVLLQGGSLTTTTRTSSVSSTFTTSTRTTSTSSGSCPTAVSIQFTVKKTTNFGDTVKVVGSIPQLGNWSPANAPALSANQYTSTNPIWQGTVTGIPAGQVFNYKYAVIGSSGSTTWESDPNRAYTAPACSATAQISDTWR